ncbi:glycosyltransferase family 52 [Chitinibacteraceae bacterium HSL-7]
MSRRLLICATPLHALIAERLIAAEPAAHWQLLYYTYLDNEKSRHYYHRLAARCQFSRYVVLAGGGGARLLRVRRAALGWGALDVVYLGAVHEWLAHYLISCLRYSRLETFDDGLANLTAGGICDVAKPLGMRRRVLARVLGIRHDLDSVRATSACHHTIYLQPNVFARTRYLPLFDAVQVSGTPSRRVSVFLGQPVYEGDRESSQQLSQRVVDALAPDLYFPHPREDYAVVGVAPVVVAEVFEDWLARELAARPDTAFEVISFFSSALMSVAGWPRVTALAIELPEPRLAAVYVLLRDAGVPLVSVESLKARV